jgi:hypothetical protein
MPGTPSSPAAHAAARYRKLLRALGFPAREAEHLHEIEQKGESPETPLIAFLGLILFLLPIVAVFLALAFGAYYLAR